MAVNLFLDTSVLLAGLVDVGPASAPAQQVLHAVAERRFTQVSTAWHCCLEAFSVATRLPPEFRLTPSEVATLLDEEVFGRMVVHDLPHDARLPFLRWVGQDGVTGGRVYDAHIAETARHAGATVIVTDNRKHFVSVLRHGIRVETAPEFAASLKRV